MPSAFWDVRGKERARASEQKVSFSPGRSDMAVVATVLVFLCVCAGGAFSQMIPPAQGVTLATVTVSSDQFDSLPNISVISSSDVTNDKGIICATALDQADVGEWLFPDGTAAMGSGFTVDPLYVLFRTGRVVLHGRRELPVSLEGIYTCNIPDEDSEIQVQYIGIYASPAPPVLNSPPQLEVMTASSSSSTTLVNFTLTCTSTAFPPTTVTWTLDSEALPEGVSDSSQQLQDAPTSTFENTLVVTSPVGGTYRCTVGNSQGDNSMETVVRVPSGPPTNVQVETLGNNMVRVTWTPPTNINCPSNVDCYAITYEADSFANSVSLDDATANSVTLEGLQVGSEYEVRVQAFGDLPGTPSDPIAITLQAPSPPTGVVIVPQGNGLLVSWNAVDNADDYEVIYTPVEGACEEVEGGRMFVSEEEVNLQMLEDGTEYSVTVRSRGGDGVGLTSDPTLAATSIRNPIPPEIISVQGKSSPDPTGFTVAWTDIPCTGINHPSLNIGYNLRYRRVGTSEYRQRVTSSNPFTFLDSDLDELVEYEVQIASVNDLGMGDYSSPKIAVILAAPGPVSALRASADIVSILITWEAPSDEVGGAYVSDYKITHLLTIADANPIDVVTVNSSFVMSLEISNLIPNTFYQIDIQPFIEDHEGRTMTSVLSTRQIGIVFGVNVTPFNASSVRVLWKQLDSQDISLYRVYYTPATPSRRRQATGGSVQVTSDADSALVVDLEGAEYIFEVVGVVMVNGLEQEGERSTSQTLFVEGFTDSESLSSSSIAGIIVSVVALVVVVVIFIIAVFMWHRSTRGKYVIKTEHNYELKPKQPSVMPLPDFEPFVSTLKPVIQHYPPDMVAMEGERVTIRPVVSGSPPPTVAWYHDNCMVSSDYSHEVKDDGTLILVCAELKQSGEYRFTVSNNAGSIQGQVQVKVYSEDDALNNGLLKKDEFLNSNKVKVKDFGKYVESLHAISNKGFKEQFFRLPSGEDHHSVMTAQRPDNKHLNRFTNITVYDDNRVSLKPIENIPSCQHEYINACYMNGFYMTNKFVVTQGPMETTVVDFWRMVWQLRMPTIVMITNLKEAGKVKCMQYWPEMDAVDYGPFRVFLSGETVYGNYVIRTFHVNLTTTPQAPFKVVQYHFTAWPDHGIPNYVAPMLAFHRRIKAEHKSMLGPMLVHCSAGVGRSGTFIALDILLQHANSEDYVDVPAVISNLRHQRMKMVQTKEQYMYLHDAILESLVCGNTQIPGHDLQRTMEVLHRWDPKTGLSGFQTRFQVLEQVSPKPDEGGSVSAKGNMKKNRYENYLPSDKHRVVLKAEFPDYIHATFIDGYKEQRKFIIAQSPLPSTSRDFWKMVYERNCGSIVMLCGMTEDEEEVCHKYWPTQVEHYGEYDVSLLEGAMYEGFLERIYSVTDSRSGQAHRVSQFQVVNWDRNGIAFNKMAVLTIMNYTTKLQQQKNSNSNGPVVVHCSDTVTRCGIFCAVSNSIECYKVEKTVDIFQIVKILRSQRPGAIPTVEQYQIIHDFLLYHIQGESAFEHRRTSEYHIQRHSSSEYCRRTSEYRVTSSDF